MLSFADIRVASSKFLVAEYLVLRFNNNCPLDELQAGEPVGYVRKVAAARGDECPWQVFDYSGTHPQTGKPCVGNLLESCYDCPDWKAWAFHVLTKQAI